MGRCCYHAGGPPRGECMQVWSHTGWLVGRRGEGRGRGVVGENRQTNTDGKGPATHTHEHWYINSSYRSATATHVRLLRIEAGGQLGQLITCAPSRAYTHEYTGRGGGSKEWHETRLPDLGRTEPPWTSGTRGGLSPIIAMWLWEYSVFVDSSP